MWTNIVITNKWHDVDRLSLFTTENNPKYGNTDLKKKNSTDFRNPSLAQKKKNIQNFWLY